MHFIALKLLTSGGAVVTDFLSVAMETNHRMKKKQCRAWINDGMEISAAF
jgi:hypothetical protein